MDNKGVIAWQNVKTSKMIRTKSPGTIKKIKQQENQEMNSNRNRDLGFQTTANKFSLLSPKEDPQLEKKDKKRKCVQSKPPPIIIPNVENISAMMNFFSQVIDLEDFKYKTMRNNQLRIVTKTVEAYKSLLMHLRNGQVNYHTYQLKEDRTFKVVIKNLHHSTPLSDLKAELQSKGHTVRHILNVRGKLTQLPLPVFFVELEPASNNQDVFNIKNLHRAIVSISPLRKLDEVIQCQRCQELGHSKNYCTKKENCAKCGWDHPSDKCLRTSDTPVICVNCHGNHLATSKDCEVYKIHQLKHELAKNKSRTQAQNGVVQTLPSNETILQRDHNLTSYADILKDMSTADPIGMLEKLVQNQIELSNKFQTLMKLLQTKFTNLFK